MGLLKKVFGKDDDYDDSEEKAMLAEEKQQTEAETAKYNALKKQQEEDRYALKQRGKGQRGGGRTGLMYGGNQQGVA